MRCCAECDARVAHGTTTTECTSGRSALYATTATTTTETRLHRRRAVRFRITLRKDSSCYLQRRRPIHRHRLSRRPCDSRSGDATGRRLHVVATSRTQYFAQQRRSSLEHSEDQASDVFHSRQRRRSVHCTRQHTHQTNQ